MVAYACNSTAEESEPGGSLELAGQPAQSHWQETLFQKTRRERTAELVLWLPHICACMYTWSCTKGLLQSVRGRGDTRRFNSHRMFKHPESGGVKQRSLGYGAEQGYPAGVVRREAAHRWWLSGKTFAPITVLPSPSGVLLLPVSPVRTQRAMGTGAEGLGDWVGSILEIPVSFPSL